MLLRTVYGALGGIGATVALTALRKTLARVGIVDTTTPEQVVARLEELGLVDDWTSGARRALAVAAHLVYGAGTGAAFGLLRRRRGGKTEEAAIGSALGILAWGAGWASWLPLAGVHEASWKQQTPKVLLPVLDHAVFGVAWGLLHRKLGQSQG